MNDAPAASAPSAEALADQLGPRSPAERLAYLGQHFAPERILVTSSFGADAPLMLHLISRFLPRVTIYFIDTGYHFPETLAFKERLTREWGLRVQSLQPAAAAHEQTRRQRLWAHDPDRCCEINKLGPFAQLDQRAFDLWLSGLMAHQSPERANLPLVQAKASLLKCYPLIDVPEGFPAAYRAQYQLPQHPLVPQGYCSIGCTHCTRPGNGREGRWQHSAKTECGLHW
jgi:phosphoadenosine phosphosulfate reductase